MPIITNIQRSPSFILTFPFVAPKHHPRTRYKPNPGYLHQNLDGADNIPRTEWL